MFFFVKKSKGGKISFLALRGLTLFKLSVFLPSVSISAQFHWQETVKRKHTKTDILEHLRKLLKDLH